MTKLTDTQLVVLSAASNREDGSILPLPANLKGGAAAKVVDGLIRRGLAEIVPEGEPTAPNSRGPNGRAFRITRAGLLALNIDPDEGAEAADGDGGSAAPTPAARRNRKKVATGPDATSTPGMAGAGTKQALLIDLLRRPEGATVDQIAEALKWQRHTVRGAIAGALKKKLGLTVESEKVDGVGRVYKIAG